MNRVGAPAQVRTPSGLSYCHSNCDVVFVTFPILIFEDRLWARLTLVWRDKIVPTEKIFYLNRFADGLSCDF